MTNVLMKGRNPSQVICSENSKACDDLKRGHFMDEPAASDLSGANARAREDEGPFSHISNPRKRAFLRNFATCGMVGRAAKDAGLHADTPYCLLWRKDEEFQAAMELARTMAVEKAEAEAQRRAVEGTRRLKFDKDGNALRDPERCECGRPRKEHVRQPGGGWGPHPEVECPGFEMAYYVEHEFSDKLLELLLKAGKPERYAEQVRIKGALGIIDWSKLTDAQVLRLSEGEDPRVVLQAPRLAAGGPAPAEIVVEAREGRGRGRDSEVSRMGPGGQQASPAPAAEAEAPGPAPDTEDDEF